MHHTVKQVLGCSQHSLAGLNGLIYLVLPFLQTGLLVLVALDLCERCSTLFLQTSLLVPQGFFIVLVHIL